MIFRGNKPLIDINQGPVLIVDERVNYKIREITAKQFANWGYAVFVAQDAEIALSISTDIKPALVVLGEITEYMSAFAFVQKLREKMEGNPPPICVLVGTWPYDTIDREAVPIISISSIISVNEFLEMENDLCAA